MNKLFTLIALIAVLLSAPAAQAAGPGEIAFDETTLEVIEEAGVALVVIERSRGEDGAVSIDYTTTTGGTATEGADYRAVSGTLFWSNQDESDQVIEVPIIDDAEAEGVERFGLRLSNPTGGAIIRAGRGSAEVVILASDGGSGGGGGGGGGGVDDGGGAGELKFDESSFEVLESAGVAIIRVERSRGETGAVSVDYASADGSATAGSDYTGVAGTLSWVSGDGGDKTFVVPILDDSDAEGDETIQLTLFNPTGGAITNPERDSSIIRILANDGGSGGGGGGGGGGGASGTLKFSSASYQVLEQGGMALITVERSQGENGAVAVTYTTFDGSATDGSDYTGVSGTLQWTAGDGSNKTFMVPVLDDNASEGNETVTLQLTGSTGGAVIDPLRGDATLTILDDDNQRCPSDDSTLCLLGGRFRVGIQFTTPAGATLPAKVVVLSDKSGLFYYFDRNNFEFLVKAVDACNAFGAYWFSYAATTTLDIAVTVTDTETGQSRTYTSLGGQAAAPVFDSTTFTSCP